MLLPGTACSERLWTAVAADLGDVAVRHAEIRGRTVDAAVGRLLDVLPARFALAGLSLGAIVAMALVRTAPERVTRLALLASNARPPTAAQRDAWRRQRDELAAGRAATALQQDLLPVLLAPASRSEALDAAVVQMAADVGEEALDEQLALQATRIDERPALRDVRAPTLVVAGALDAIVDHAKHVEVASAVPGSRLTSLDGVGHLSAMEAPAAVAGLLRAWLDER